MRVEVRCPVACPMRPVKKPGDGLIRYWLSLHGWRVGHVKNGVICLPTEVHADYIETMLENKWFPDVPRPLVGVYSKEACDATTR